MKRTVETERPEVAPPLPSPSEEADAAVAKEALQLLRDPDLLVRFVADVHAAGVDGEDRLVKLVALVAASAGLENPLGMVIKASSGSGKSHVPKKVLSFFPAESVEKITGITAHALDSAGESLKHKTVYLDEAPGMEKAAGQLRVLFSEKTLVTKDPRGDRVAEGPIALITTTTAHCVEPELESRLIQMSTDESGEQTNRIVKAACRRAGAGTHATALLRSRQQLWATALAMIGRQPVTVPDLGTHFEGYFTGRLSDRRNVDKLIGVVQAHALLHRYQREEVDGAILATKADIDAALDLFKEQMKVVPSRLELITTELKEHFGNTPFTVSQAAAALGRSDAILRDLKKLLDLGLLEQPGRPRGRIAAKWLVPAGSAGVVAPGSVRVPADERWTSRARYRDSAAPSPPAPSLAA